MTLDTINNSKYTLDEDKERVAHSSWHRGETCNFIANKKNLTEENALANYVVQGWMPSEPFITRQNHITTFRNCFAQHISQYLTTQGYRTGKAPRETAEEMFTWGVQTIKDMAEYDQFRKHMARLVVK